MAAKAPEADQMVNRIPKESSPGAFLFPLRMGSMYPPMSW